MLALAPGNGKDMVQEQGHLFLQRPLRIDHAIQPFANMDGNQLTAVVAIHERHVDGGKTFGMNEIVNDFFVSLISREGVEFGRRSAETGAPHQMGCQWTSGFHLATFLRSGSDDGSEHGWLRGDSLRLKPEKQRPHYTDSILASSTPPGELTVGFHEAEHREAKPYR